MLAELAVLDGIREEDPRIAEVPVPTPGTVVERSTGHTSASTPPIVRAVQLSKGAIGKPARARSPHL